MPRDDLIALLRRLATHVKDGTTDMGADVFSVPVSNYLSPDIWQREMDVIFKRLPLLAALTCELPGNGDYKAIELAGVPVLVTRDDSGRARAFLNVCRHRGAQVAPDGCGHARRHTCPYHAWSYGNDGRLAGIYAEATFDRQGRVGPRGVGLRRARRDDLHVRQPGPDR
jgi:phenylpropionate dioxygenase-like ring-hydroxylating dioxygenase large terminal subunit